MDKQKLEEARQLAMSMISHPVAFGTIEHTEKAGELLGELAKWREPVRLTDDDINKAAAPFYSVYGFRVNEFARAIEAAVLRAQEGKV